MWLICAGAKRSGSTLQYNALAELVERSGRGKRLPFFKSEEFQEVYNNNSDYSGFLVVKTHRRTRFIDQLIEQSEAIVFHSYRDIRDVVVSAIKKGWIQKETASIQSFVSSYISEYNEWLFSTADLHSSKYEEFAFDLQSEVRKYSEILGISLAEAEFNTIINALSIKEVKRKQAILSDAEEAKAYNNTFNKNTLFHTNHVQDGSVEQYLSFLTVDEILLIESLAYSFLQTHQYSFYWPKTNRFISTSQHADDYIAWQLLVGIENGMVVEVGAFDGIHLSNSCSLSQFGWKSVCIEPNPEFYPILANNRPDSQLVNKAVVGDEKIKYVKFFSEEIGVLSGCEFDEEDLKRRYDNRGLKYTKPNVNNVAAITMATLLNDLKITHVDVLSIDVEGLEIEVLSGIDFEKVNINLFIIEANTNEARESVLECFKSREDFFYLGQNRQNLFIINKSILSRRVIKSLEFGSYIKATQYHPKGDRYFLDSTNPNFTFSKEAINFLRRFSFF